MDFVYWFNRLLYKITMDSKEKKKIGRPIKNENPRTDKLTLRLSKNELSDIEYCSKKLKLSRTDTIVKSIKELKEKL